MKYVVNLINSGNTVWKSSELGLIFGVDKKDTLKNIIQRLSKSGIIIYRGSGLWTLREYDHMEFASKIRKKSYISLESVLQKAGVIFQDYSHSVTLVSDNSIDVNIDGISYNFSKIKDEILTNTLGIYNTGRYMIATPERALCDRIYLTPKYYFDNLGGLDKDLLGKLSTIYNKRTFLEIKKIINDMK